MFTKKILIIWVILSLWTMQASAQQPNAIDIDPSTVKMVEKVIDDIVVGIHKLSESVPELKRFSSGNVVVNEFGMKSIKFKEVPEYDLEREPLEFGVNVVPIGEMNVFEGDIQAYHFTFPFIGIKIAAFQSGETARRPFDILKLIKKHGVHLLDHQQEYMPFRMSITSSKLTYKIGEKIRFSVRLTNSSQVNLQVYKLTVKSLYIKINDSEWGNPKGEKNLYYLETVLSPGEHIEKDFDIGPYDRAENIEILGVYHRTFEGVNPSAVLNLKVVR